MEEEQEFAEVHGIVTWVGKRVKFGNLWGSTDFKIKTPKMGVTFFVRSENPITVEREDAIYLCGYCKEDVDDGEKIYLMDINEIPIVEPRVSRSAIVKVFINSMYIVKNVGFALKNERANRIFDHIYQLTSEMEEYEGLDDSHQVNQYMTKLSNMMVSAGAAGREEAIKTLIEPFGGVASTTAEQEATQLLYFWYKERELRKLLMLGLSEAEVKKSIYPTDILYRKIRSNPYTVPIVDQEKATELMERFNMIPSDLQLKCGEIVRYLYNNVENKGWACTPVNVAHMKFSNIGQFIPELTAEVDSDGETEFGYDIVSVKRGEKTYLYFRLDHQAEFGVAEKLISIMKQPLNAQPDPIRFHTSLSEDQITAVEGILKWPITVLTGSGGTGKTATITEIVKNLIARRIMFVVTSFTGKAVSRVKQEMKKTKVSDFYRLSRTLTLHRAIYKGLPCSDDQLTHLIIDEASMVTTKLLHMFFSRFKNIQWILLVGDCNQLLPIGWGCLFKNIIESGVSPVFRLTKVHRVVKMEGIKDGITNACQSIAEAPEGLEIQFEETENFQMIPGDETVLFSILDDMKNAGIEDCDMTVVTPYNKVVANTNTFLQSLYRGDAPEVRDTFKRKWKVGDRVVMLENNYEINVMNGDEGRVLGILPGTGCNPGNLEVGFDSGEDENPLHLTTMEAIEKYVKRYRGTDKIHKFSLSSKPKNGESYHSRGPNVGMLQHGYSITVHKCVSGDTLVPTSNGLQYMEDLVTDDGWKKKTIAVETRTGTENTCATFKGKEEPSIIITTKLGYTIEGSHRHPVLIRDEEGVEKWKKLPEIEEGDCVVLRKNYADSSDYVKIDENGHTNVDVVDEDFGYLLGILVGDGCYTDKRDGTVEFTNNCESLLEKFEEISNRLFKLRVCYYKHKTGDKSPKKYFCRKNVRKTLLDLGLDYRIGPNKITPWCVLKSPKSVKKLYIKGLFDTDGGVNKNCIHFTTSSCKLAREVHIMLLSLDIISSLKYMPNDHAGAWRITITGVDSRNYMVNIGFDVEHKNASWKKYHCDRKISDISKSNIGYFPDSVAMSNEFKNDYSLKGKLSCLMSRCANGNSRIHMRHTEFIKKHIDLNKSKSGRELLKYESLGLFCDKIIDIKESKCVMYDLEVPGSHSFISNGIVSHNSQGSEWDFIIFYIPENSKPSRNFLNRNLLYTGSSRGKRCLRVVGDVNAFIKGCTMRPLFRHELLGFLLKEALPQTGAGLDGRDILIGVFSPEELYAMNQADDFDDFDDY
jgi:intein/homing endonuclease